MFWIFKKPVPAALVEVPDDAEEDMKQAVFIQQRCQIGSLFAARLSDPDEDHDDARRRYTKVRDEIIAALDTIDDDFSRGFGAHQIIKMCMGASEEVVARAVLVSVRDEFIREKIFENFPQLKTKKT